MKWNRVETCQCCHHRNIDAWRSVGSPPRMVYLECRDCHLCGPRRLTLSGAQIGWNRMQKKIKKNKEKYGWKR